MKQCGKILFSVFYIMLAVIFLAAILRVFVCDQFEINGESMSPTLVSGDHVLVNKLLMGARIYTKYDFSVFFRIRVDNQGFRTYVYSWKGRKGNH